jgi:dethiobiotin synthetase
MKKKGIFISATDTGVGKTWITGGLAALLRNRGLHTGVWKPVQSGCLHGDPEADSHVLKLRSGVEDTETEISPFSFRAPLAPAIAAFIEGKSLELDDIISAGDKIFERYDSVLVEGVGGLAAPLNEKTVVVDLAVRLGLPIIIVARPGLGTINHTLLSISYARNSGLSVLGIIFNGYEPPMPNDIRDLNQLKNCSGLENSELSNPFLVQAFSGSPILGRVPLVSDDANLKEQINIINCNVHIEKVISVLRD